MKDEEKTTNEQAVLLEVKLDGVGKAANAFAEAIRASEKASEERGKCESKLIAALKRKRRTSIKVLGFTFNLSHVGPKDKITVQKPK